MDSENERPGLYKVGFELEVDEEGWPPVAVEWMWARRADGENTYILQNIPFFVRGFALLDQVRVTVGESSSLWCEEMVGASGNSTLRVICEPSDIERLQASLDAIGCGSEISHLPNLLAVNVPPSVAIDIARRVVSEAPGVCEYEEACLAQP